MEGRSLQLILHWRMGASGTVSDRLPMASSSSSWPVSPALVEANRSSTSAPCLSPFCACLPQERARGSEKWPPVGSVALVSPCCWNGEASLCCRTGGGTPVHSP
eukprot:scaffold6924_cov16-Tisochrysis_lutea.AAC.1